MLLLSRMGITPAAAGRRYPAAGGADVRRVHPGCGGGQRRQPPRVRPAATTGNNPALDTLILQLHIETACRRAGALALRPVDLDPDQCLVLLRGKGDTFRRQPVSPTLMAHYKRTPRPRRTGRGAVA